MPDLERIELSVEEVTFDGNFGVIAEPPVVAPIFPAGVE
jgi:hypothetical protein